MKKTILILTPDSIRKPYGGLGVYLQETLERFPSNYRFLVIGIDTDETHHGSNYFYTSLKNMNDISESAKMLKECSLIHAMDANTFPTAIQFKNFLKIPFIAHVHLSEDKLVQDLSKFIHISEYPIHMANAEQAGLTAADHIIHVSKAMAKRFPYPEKTSVVWNGINAADFTKPVKKVKLPGLQNNRKVVFIGRFTFQKGIHELVRATIPKNVNVYLIGGGNGSNPYLTQEVVNQSTKQPNIFYLGALWGEEKRSVLAQCDAMIVPSLHEPFGIVGLEAIASDNLLISSWATGLSDFATYSNSLFCGSTATSISEALHRFATMDAQYMAMLKHNAKQLLPVFTWESTVQKLISIYQHYIK